MHMNVTMDVFSNSAIPWFLVNEAREFIDNHDQDTLLDSTFPSKNITIAELMMLQSKFGPILASDIIGKVSSSKVDQNFKVFIGRKIIFVKKGMKHFKRYTGKHQGVPAESISYRRWDLEEFTQASITSQKESRYWFSRYIYIYIYITCCNFSFFFFKVNSDETSPAHLFHDGDQVEVIADTTPGVDSRHSVGIGQLRFSKLKI